MTPEGVWRQLAWELVWTRSARAELARLPTQMQRRVGEALERYAATGQGDVRQLAGRSEWSLRVGEWRVLFRPPRVETRPPEPPTTEQRQVRVLDILAVRPRGRAYQE